MTNRELCRKLAMLPADMEVQIDSAYIDPASIGFVDLSDTVYRRQDIGPVYHPPFIVIHS